MPTVVTVTILLWTIGVLAGVFVVLTSGIVLRKAWRESREARDLAHRRTLEPAILAYARSADGSIRSVLGPSPRARDLRVAEGVLLSHAERARWAELERIARALDDLGFVDRYRAALGSRSAWRRAWAAERLGVSRAQRALPELERALSDPSHDVRLRAARAVHLAGGAGSVRHLMIALDRPDRWASIRVADVIAETGRTGVADLIAHYRSLGPSGRLAALDAIARARSVEAVAWLFERLRDPDPDARARAAHALGVIGDPSATPPLVDALRDAEWPVRAMAAKALGRLGADEAIPALKRAMRDPAWWVRSNAAHAIGAFGEAGVVALEEMLDSPDPYARAQAVLVLEENGVVDARVPGLLSDSGTERHAAALFATRVAEAGGTERLSQIAADAGDRPLGERLRAFLERDRP